jgi:hypothetical protein
LSGQGFVKLGGIATVLSAILVAVTYFISGYSLYAWIGLASSIIIIPAILAFWGFIMTDDNGLELVLAVVAMITGLYLRTGNYLNALMKLYMEASFTEPHIKDAILATLHSTRFTTNNAGSFLLFGVAVILFGYAELKGDSLPIEHALLGMIAGIINLTWLGLYEVSFLQPGTLTFNMPYLGLALYVIWQLILGVIMVMD